MSKCNPEDLAPLNPPEFQAMSHHEPKNAEADGLVWHLRHTMQAIALKTYGTRRSQSLVTRHRATPQLVSVRLWAIHPTREASFVMVMIRLWTFKRIVTWAVLHPCLLLVFSSLEIGIARI